MPGYEWMGETEKEQINEVLDTGILFRYEFKNERKGIYKYENLKKNSLIIQGRSTLKR